MKNHLNHFSNLLIPNRLRHCLLVVLLCSTVNQSCTISTSNPESFKNEAIYAETREEISKLNKTFFDAIMQKKSDVLLSLCSDAMKATIKPEDKLLEKILAMDFNGEFSVLDQYYMTDATLNMPCRFESEPKAEDRYSVNFKAIDKNVFASIHKADIGAGQMLFTLIYGKTGNGWKINILHLGEYALRNQNAIEYYKKAKEQYRDSCLIEALFKANIAKNFLRPGGNYFTYGDESKILEFEKMLNAEVSSKVKLPVTYFGINGNPVLFGLQPVFFKDDFYPVIQFKTSLKIPEDTTEIRKQADLIHTEIQQSFGCLTSAYTLILYKAWPEIPDGKKQLPNFTIAKRNF